MAERRLFAVYVGGTLPGANVELHDVRFAVGARIEDCYDALRAQWWGDPRSLHLDAWGKVHDVDGWRVTIGEARPPTAGPRLWFVNLGGYDPAQFTELHENLFVVAETAADAKRQAIARVRHWVSPHKDAVMNVERAIDVSAGFWPEIAIGVTPGGSGVPFRFETRYTPIGSKE